MYETGLKIGFILRRQGEYYRSESKRRLRHRMGEWILCFSSPEDTILSKLIWAKEGASEKQFEEALGVTRVQQSTLDFEYLNSGENELTVRDLLERTMNEIKK
jgi:hypothetical protein